jgi:DNA-binding transcriptional MerR regulator
MKSQQDDLQMIIRVAHQCGVTTEALHEWLQEHLIPLRDNQWDDEAIETVRRIRRLSALGINTAGIEVALYMRQQMIQFQQDMLRLQQQHEEMQARYEAQIRQLMKDLSTDL